MTSLAVNYSKKSIVFITGASRGIGQTIAIELARRINENSLFILFARSQNGLDETKQQILNVNKNITVQTYAVDLAKPELNSFNNIFDNVLSGIDSTCPIEYGYIFHNAGDIGKLKDSVDLTDISLWQNYYDFNLFSAILLNNVFIKKIEPITSRLVVVNMTSLVGRKPFVNMAMYGSGKAARDLFFQVLAEEHPSITVLNYSPGPVKTDMFLSICEESESENLRNSFQKVRDTSVLTTNQTIEKLLNVLEKGDYKNGGVIDYYDRF